MSWPDGNPHYSGRDPRIGGSGRMRTKAVDGFETKGPDVVAAFDILFEIIEGAVEAVNRDGAAAQEFGEYDLALQHVDCGKAIAEPRQKSPSSRDEW